MTEKHECYRCRIEESTFWFPHSFGCGRSMNNPRYAAGGEYYELCDRCEREWRRFMWKV